MIQQKLSKVATPDDPRRCQAIFNNGQCQFICIPGFDMCAMHAAGHENKIEKRDVRNYNISKWQSRINTFADSSQVKSLREEIGILRIVLEETLNRCQDSDDLLLYSSRIADHILKIEKLVKSCHQLEYQTGNLLDKTTILHLSTTIIEIIHKYIPDPTILDQVGNEIVDTIVQTQLLKEDKNDNQR